MSSGQRQYEFTTDQNSLIGAMAHRMGWVGFFLTFVGVITILAALLMLGTIYQDRIPQEWVSKATPEMKEKWKDVQDELQKNLPSNNYQLGFVIVVGVGGLINLLMGIWTRSAAASFRQIVKTTGSDITHLMNALGGLNHMYSLVYTLLVLTLIAVLAGVGWVIYGQYAV